MYGSKCADTEAYAVAINGKVFINDDVYSHARPYEEVDRLVGLMTDPKPIIEVRLHNTGQVEVLTEEDI